MYVYDDRSNDVQGVSTILRKNKCICETDELDERSIEAKTSFPPWMPCTPEYEHIYISFLCVRFSKVAIGLAVSQHLPYYRQDYEYTTLSTYQLMQLTVLLTIYNSPSIWTHNRQAFKQTHNATRVQQGSSEVRQADVPFHSQSRLRKPR